IFGEDPVLKEPELVLHSSVTARWKKYLSDGLTKEVKDSLLKKYPRKGKLSIEPPILNDEVAVNLKESALKTDKYFFWNAAKLLIEIHRSQTVARKACILPTLSKQWATALEKRVTDDYLFGEKLVDKVKEIKAISKVGEKMKSAPVKKAFTTPGHLNARSSSGEKKSFAPASRKTTTTAATAAKKPLTSRKQSGAIVETQEVFGQFLSPFFLVPKSDGQQRFILNLKALNTFINAEHFKLEDVRSACSLMENNIWMGTIDLKDAYFLIPVWRPHRKFLRFIFNEKIFEFVCLPFGLCTCPLAFTKLLKPVINYLRLQGWLSVVYLDDFLCLGRSVDECSENLTQTIELLKKLGFIAKKMLKIRDFAKVVGSVVACCPAVEYSLLHCRLFERAKIQALNKSDGCFDALMAIPKYTLKDWDWWLKALPKASAYCNGETANGLWNQEERDLHINHLELKAAFLALKCFAADLRDSDVLLMVDNTTTLAYINRMEGVRYSALHKLACELWNWCGARQLWVYASYIPSKENVEADHSSRIDNSDAEWELAEYAFRRITMNFGNLEIDLFASRINAKCATYCSWKRDPGAFAFDAFTI
ncbi:GSCOCG00011357001-RA-CDS, partial [Cotesia congregata]